MLKKGEKTVYYISNVGTCSVSMIDGDKCRRIKDIKTDSRPQNIEVDNNNVYIACDRNHQITCINNSDSIYQTWDIPNSGELQIDSSGQKIYVCNTDEIGIYNLTDGSRIYNIKGFTAAYGLKLNKNKSRLFVMDVLENIIKVFSTDTYKLIKTFLNVGIAPIDFIIGINERYLYIANKGMPLKDINGGISVIDMDTDTVSFIDMKRNSSITGLELDGNYLFAANNGLQQIEVIDLAYRQCVASIRTTLSIIQRIRISPESGILLALSIDKDGKGVLDRINIERLQIKDTFYMEENELPYDIRAVTLEDIFNHSQTKEEEAVNILRELLTQEKVGGNKEQYTENGNKKEPSRSFSRSWRDKNIPNSEIGINILAKEIISSHQEKIYYPEIQVEVPSSEIGRMNYEEIIFLKCEMVKESLIRKAIQNRKEYSFLQYNYFIPYYIEYREKSEKMYALKGKITGTQKITLYLPSVNEQSVMEYNVLASASLSRKPIYRDNILTFEVNAMISTLVVTEREVFIPFIE